MSNRKYFLYYSSISVSKGQNTELKTSELCLERYDKVLKNVVIVNNWNFKKILKKTMILAMCVLNFYKKKTKLIRLFILFGKATQNIGFLQTCIVYKCLEESQL